MEGSIQAIQDIALSYYEAGLSILPIRSNSKRPAIQEWKALQSNRATREQVQNWFKKHENIAIIGGQVSGGVVVLDFDYAAETIFALFNERLETLLKQLPIIKTGKGYHVYFRCDNPIGNEKLACSAENQPYIETRGEGGYVIAPPSIHPSGKHYVTIQGDLCQIPQLNSAESTLLLDTARSFDKRPNSAETTVPPVPPTNNQAPNEKRANAILTALLNNVRNAAEGTRHDTLLKNSRMIGGYMAGGFFKLTDHEASDLLYAAAEQCGLVKDEGSNAARQTIRDGLNHGKNAPVYPQDRPKKGKTIRHGTYLVDKETGEILSVKDSAETEPLPTLDELIAACKQVGGGDDESADLATAIAERAGHLHKSDWYKLRRRLAKHARLGELDVVYKEAVQQWTNVQDDLETSKRGYKTKEPKSADFVAALNSLGYQFRMNDLDDSVEFSNGERVTDAHLAQIEMAMWDLGFKRSQLIHSTLIATAHQNRYHPIRAYLDNLTWDGNDHIAQLLNHITFSANTGDVGRMFFRKWFVGAVAKVYQHAQNFMLVLDGKQGTGKSHLVRWLCPLPAYYSESHITPHDKDSRLELARTWIWEVAELQSTFKKADREALKATITRQYVNERKAYGRMSIQKPVLASFIGTINESGAGFLNDPTGSRRFAVVNIQSINWLYTNAVQSEQLWAQAVAEYRGAIENNIELWRLDPNESARQREINEQYEAGSMVADLLAEHATLTPDATDQFLTITEIILRLATWGLPIRNEKTVQMEAAEYLKKHGLEKRRIRINGQHQTVWVGIQLEKCQFKNQTNQ